MSTRGVIAFKTEEGWKGVYNHLDSYPDDLGQSLVTYIEDKMKEGLSKKEAIQYLIDNCIKDGKGWYAFPDSQYEESEELMDQDNFSPLFMEYIYILDPETESMNILAHKYVRVENGKKINDKDVKPENRIEYILIKGKDEDYGKVRYDYGSSVIFYEFLAVFHFNAGEILPAEDGFEYPPIKDEDRIPVE